jgi:hypothetical protein
MFTDVFFPSTSFRKVRTNHPVTFFEFQSLEFVSDFVLRFRVLVSVIDSSSFPVAEKRKDATTMGLWRHSWRVKLWSISQVWCRDEHPPTLRSPMEG